MLECVHLGCELAQIFGQAPKGLTRLVVSVHPQFAGVRQTGVRGKSNVLSQDFTGFQVSVHTAREACCLMWAWPDECDRT